MNIVDSIREVVKTSINGLAKHLNKMTDGKISPNFITIFGFLMHIPIAVLIANGNHMVAAILLIIFGLFDSLDGSLARLQNRASNAGMLLDASTDRMKEVILYAGATAFFVATPNTAFLAIWAVIACGASLTVSYVKAKGETAVAGQNLSANEVNRLFQDGFARFEIRMTLLVLGLFTGFLDMAIILIAIISAYTAIQRLANISRKLS